MRSYSKPIYTIDQGEEVARVETKTSFRGGPGTSAMKSRETGTILKKKRCSILPGKRVQDRLHVALF